MTTASRYYNDLRRAYGLQPVRSFTDITGESTDQFPPGLTINSPAILDFVKLLDDQGNVIPLGSDNAQEDAIVGISRSTLAARLKAIYGDVDKVDAFVGMVSEKHVPGTEFGPAPARDVDEAVRRAPRRRPLLLRERSGARPDPADYGVTYKVTLSQLLKLDAGVSLQPNVFLLASNQPTLHDQRLHGHRRPRPQRALGSPGGSDRGYDPAARRGVRVV